MALWAPSTQLSAYLSASGLRANPPDDFQAMLDMETVLQTAQDMYEQTVGYIPLLASAQTRTYDPPGPNQASGTILAGLASGVNTKGGGRKLQLGAGLLACTSVKVGVSSTSAGTTLIQGQDYWLRPNNSLNYTRPYTYIEFRYPQYDDAQSIQVTGLWGYATILLDGAITSGSNQLTTFVGLRQAHVGKFIRVVGAGAAGADLNTTITAVDVTGTIATLGLNAATTVNPATAFFAAPPAGVAQGVVAYAAFLLAPQIATYISKGRVRWREGDVEEDYSRGKGTNPLDEFQDRCQAQFKAALALYFRPFIG